MRRVCTVIQLRRFMLLFLDVDFCASAMDVKLNSCSYCEVDTFKCGLEAVVPVGSCSETIPQGSSTAFQSIFVDHRLHSWTRALLSSLHREMIRVLPLMIRSGTNVEMTIMLQFVLQGCLWRLPRFVRRSKGTGSHLNRYRSISRSLPATKHQLRLSLKWKPHTMCDSRFWNSLKLWSHILWTFCTRGTRRSDASLGTWAYSEVLKKIRDCSRGVLGSEPPWCGSDLIMIHRTPCRLSCFPRVFSVSWEMFGQCSMFSGKTWQVRSSAHSKKPSQRW